MAETKSKKDTYHHGDLRRVLLDAARAELEESGVEAFSLRKVARRAGVSHAAPAHHFGDVAGLLTDLATEGYCRFLTAMEAREAAAEPTPRAQLLAAGLGYLDFAMKEQALFKLIHASDKPKAENRHLYEAGIAAYDHLVDLVVAVTGRPANSSETQVAVASIWAQAHGLADLVSNRRLKSISDLDPVAREAAVCAALARVLP